MTAIIHKTIAGRTILLLCKLLHSASFSSMSWQ